LEGGVVCLVVGFLRESTFTAAAELASLGAFLLNGRHAQPLILSFFIFSSSFSLVLIFELIVRFTSKMTRGTM
jgi:hypothetical protein